MWCVCVLSFKFGAAPSLLFSLRFCELTLHHFCFVSYFFFFLAFFLFLLLLLSVSLIYPSLIRSLPPCSFISGTRKSCHDSSPFEHRLGSVICDQDGCRPWSLVLFSGLCRHVFRNLLFVCAVYVLLFSLFWF